MAAKGDQKRLANGSSPILISAPGKIILHGEHAVVYGTTALASALNLRSYLRLQQQDAGQLQLNLPDIDLRGSWDVQELQEKFASLLRKDPMTPSQATPEDLQELKLFFGYGDAESTKRMAVLAFFYLYLSIAGKTGQLPILDILVSSALPAGAGLGSSAAYSVCLATGLLSFVQAITPVPVNHNSGTSRWSKADLELINKWAYEGERLIHGNPSGIDNSVSVYGGAIEYKGKVITPIDKMPELSILLVNTKVPRSTKELVAGVRQRHDKHPKIYDPIFEAMEQIAHESKETLQGIATRPGDIKCLFGNLEELVDVNQQLLSVIGVSHESINNVCRFADAYALHAKLTGAGGGGCVFALLPPYIPADGILALQKDLHSQNYDSWQTTLGARGVLMHQSQEALSKGRFLIPDSFLA